MRTLNFILVVVIGFGIGWMTSNMWQHGNLFDKIVGTVTFFSWLLYLVTSLIEMKQFIRELFPPRSGEIEHL